MRNWLIFASRQHPNDLPVVLKVIDKSCLSADQIQQLDNEVDILRSLHHPNVIELIFDDETPTASYQVFYMNMVFILLQFF